MLLISAFQMISDIYSQATSGATGFGVFNFYGNRKVYYGQRTYSKIQDILALIISVSNVLIILSKLVILRFVDHLYKEEIVNEFFRFPKVDSSQTNHLDRNFESNSDIIKTTQLQLKTTPKRIFIAFNPEKTYKTIVFSSLEIVYTKYLSMFSRCFSKKLIYDHAIFDDAYNFITNSLKVKNDLGYLVELTKQLEKIKFLMLNKNQRAVFNLNDRVCYQFEHKKRKFLDYSVT